MLNILKNTINRVFASGVDSDASAFITATGLSSTTQKSAITTLVKDLKSSGLWSKMKAVYPMVTDNYNLLSYTEDFSNAAWGKVAITISTNTITAPNGTLTADSLIEDTASNSHLTHNSAPLSIPTGNLTSSIYVKKGNRDWFYLNLYNGTTSLIAWFNINTGTIGTIQSGLTASIQDVGNGWYRLSATRNIATTNNAYVQYGASNADNVTNYTGNGLVASYIWGAQYEVSTTASTYQPIATTPSAFMASQMKYNLKDARDLDAAFRLTWSGGWTYSATGATPNGTNAYADTKLDPSINLTASNIHISSYSRTNSDGVFNEIGAFTANPNAAINLYPRLTNVSYNDIGLSNTGRVTYANTDSTGYYIASRTSNVLLKAYKNNTLKGSYTTADNATFGSVKIFLSAQSANNVAAQFSNRQNAFTTIGDGLNETEVFLLNQIVEKYQVALSRGVQAAQSFYYNSTYSNEANTYLYSTQITGTTQVSAINTLINGLKANNLWSKMKAVYPFVTDKYNYLGYTEDVTNAVWGKNPNATTAANTTTAPNGTLTADTIGNSGVANSIYQLAVSSSSSLTYTTSIYIKQKTNRYFKLCLTGGTGANQRYAAIFDMSNGTFVSDLNTSTQLTNKSYSITDDGNGWYRVSVTATVPSTSEVYLTIESTNSTSTSINTSNLDYINPTVGECYIWGAQLQLGSLSTYQPVLGANSYSTNVAAQMKFNLVNPQDTDAAFRLAFSGGWTYSTNGALPNGTNAYADTFLIPSTNLTESSKHLSFYLRTDNLPINADPINIGALSGAQRDFLLHSRVSISGQLSSILATNLISNPLGYSLVTRSSTTNNLFKNNSKVNTASGAGTSATGKIFVGALNLNGGGYGYTNNQLALATIGDGLSDAEAALLYQLIQDYQTTLSRQV